MNFTFKIEAQLSEIPTLYTWAANCLDGHNFSKKKVNHLLLALEEVIVNIITHGYKKGPGMITIQLEIGQYQATLTITDTAPPFNPLEPKKKQSTPHSLEKTAAGGLGLFFIQNLIDESTYRREEGANVLRLHQHF